MAITYEDGSIYNATVARTTTVKAKTGTIGFRIIFTIDNEIVNGEEKDCPNYDRDVTYWLTPNTKKMFERDMGRLGITIDRQALKDGLPEIIGKSVQVRCKHEESEGKTFEKFDFWTKSTKEQAEVTKDELDKAFDMFEVRQERKASTPAAKSAVEIAAEEVF